MKAVNIQWDVDNPEDIKLLPSEIDIPEELSDENNMNVYAEEISDYISNFTGFCHLGFFMKKDFGDVKIGDIVICYDEYSHDLHWHKVKVNNIEFDEANRTITNPKGKIYFGKDLEEKNWGDDYITVVTESNFISIDDTQE